MGTYVVEEIPVVGHHNDDSLIFHEEIFQPGNGVNVQAVGGLVQEDNVRAAEEGPGQEHLHLFRFRQGAHEAVEHPVVQPQSLEELAGLGLGLPAAQLGEFRFQLSGPVAVLFREILLGIEGVLLLEHRIEPGVPLQNGLENSELLIGKVVLLQNRHAAFCIDNHFAFGGLQFSGEELQKSGFARAVSADNAIAVAGLEQQVHMGKQVLAAKAQSQIGYGNHNKIILSRPGKRPGAVIGFQQSFADKAGVRLWLP